MKKIVIIEDNVQVADTLMELLRDTGDIIRYKKFHPNLLNSIMKIRPDLIILDLMINGKMIGHRIMKSLFDAGYNNQIIVFTGHKIEMSNFEEFIPKRKIMSSITVLHKSNSRPEVLQQLAESYLKLT